MKKSYLLLSIALLVAMLLSSCASGGGGYKVDNLTADECSKPEVLCIGLVTDVGEVDDKGFNQAAWTAVEQARTEMGAKINYVETKDAKDYQSNIALFADQKADIIVGVGYAMTQALDEAALKYPDVAFIGVDQFQAEVIPNVVGLLFHEDQAGYLAGALAAMMTTTNTVAGVYGTNLIPAVVAFYEGYGAGAKSINPDINLIQTYHPGGLDVAFTDPEWGATTAKQAMDQGADVVFAAGGKTGNGALIEVAGNEGKYCIGVDLDQWETVPEAHPCLISSAVKLIVPATVNLIKLASEGQLPAGNFFGDAGLAPFHDFEDKIPQDVKDKLDEIAAGLKDGSISTGYNP